MKEIDLFVKILVFVKILSTKSEWQTLHYMAMCITCSSDQKRPKPETTNPHEGA